MLRLVPLLLLLASCGSDAPPVVPGPTPEPAPAPLVLPPLGGGDALDRSQAVGDTTLGALLDPGPGRFLLLSGAAVDGASSDVQRNQRRLLQRAQRAGVHVVLHFTDAPSDAAAAAWKAARKTDLPHVAGALTGVPPCSVVWGDASHARTLPGAPPCAWPAGVTEDLLFDLLLPPMEGPDVVVVLRRGTTRVEGAGTDEASARAAASLPGAELVTVLGPAAELGPRDIAALSERLPPGLAALSVGDGPWFGPLDALLARTWTPRRPTRADAVRAWLADASIAAGLHPDAWMDPAVTLRVRRAQTSLLDPPQRLVRGRRVDAVEPAAASAALAAYLVRRMDGGDASDAQFHPGPDLGPASPRVERQALAAEALNLLASAPEAPASVVDAARRATAALAARLEVDGAGRCILERGRCDGEAAVAVLLALLAAPEAWRPPAATLQSLLPPILALRTDEGVLRYTDLVRDPERAPRMKHRDVPGRARALLTAHALGLAVPSAVLDRAMRPLSAPSSALDPDLVVGAARAGRAMDAAAVAGAIAEGQLGPLLPVAESDAGAWRVYNDAPRTTELGTRIEALLAVAPEHPAIGRAADQLTRTLLRPSELWWTGSTAAAGCAPADPLDWTCSAEAARDAARGLSALTRAASP